VEFQETTTESFH